MSFSERYGFKPIREIIQIESIDEPLRNGLWSLLKLHVWDHVHYTSGVYGEFRWRGNQHLLCRKRKKDRVLWLQHPQCVKHIL